jgi:hypothetical protein
VPQSLLGNFRYFDFVRGGFWAPVSARHFFNFHFGGAETGSTVDRDWFAECPSGIGRDAGAESTASVGSSPICASFLPRSLGRRSHQCGI